MSTVILDLDELLNSSDLIKEGKNIKDMITPLYDPTVTDENIVGCWLDWLEKS